MSNQHVTETPRAQVHEDENVTSKGNSLGLSIVLFAVLFGLFVGGLYVMSLISMDDPSVLSFCGGLTMCLVALYASFHLVLRFLNKWPLVLPRTRRPAAAGYAQVRARLALPG